MTKELLREAILARLEADLAMQTAAAELSRDEATNEESRAENKYDTHSQEAAYLAEGRARLATEIAANIEFYRSFPLPEFPKGAAVAPGALVDLKGPGETACYFLGPRAGGLEFRHEGRHVLLVSAQSPLGGALLGRREGDIIRPDRKGQNQVILAVK